MENIVDGDKPIDSTLNAEKIIGRHVLSKEGFVFGKVTELRLSPKNGMLEGVVISRGFLKNKMYIGKSYFERVSESSIVLNIQPSILLLEKKVVSHEGKVLGRVVRIVRNGESNDLKEIVVKRIFSKEFIVSAKEISSLGKSIMLNKSYSEKSDK